MKQFFARVVELREGKIAFASESVKYDGKVTTDSPSREFLEVTCKLNRRKAADGDAYEKILGYSLTHLIPSLPLRHRLS
ncbi:MAG: hypothetical protein IJW90_00175 [Clostridia bacterium]|nr:hypothetical protein [Clostridia bacterium]